MVQGLHLDCRRVLKQHSSSISILSLFCSLNHCSLNSCTKQGAQESGYLKHKSIDTVAEACAGICVHWLYLSGLAQPSSVCSGGDESSVCCMTQRRTTHSLVFWIAAEIANSL